MDAQKNTKSKPLSLEGRVRLYGSLGNNLLAYRVQVDYLREQLQHKKDANIEIMYRMTIIGMDLCASVRACLKSDNLYERRYHIKYLWVNLYEAYNAFYSSEEDENSYVAKWVIANPAVKEDEEYEGVLQKLKDLHDVLNINIHDKRNSYVHYDDNPIKTAQYLLSINSEDEPSQRVCDLLEVFEKVKNICDRQHKLKIDESCFTISAMSMVIGDLLRNLRSDVDLMQSVNEVTGDAENKLKEAMQSYNIFNVMPFNGCEDVKRLIQAHLLVQIMRADLAVTVRSCLCAESVIESMLHIRRAIIIRQAGVEHLRDIWKTLPVGLAHETDKKKIESMLGDFPRSTRNQLVHYRYKKKDYIKEFYTYCSDGQEMVTNLTDIVKLLNDLDSLQWNLTQMLRDCHERWKSNLN